MKPALHWAVSEYYFQHLKGILPIQAGLKKFWFGFDVQIHKLLLDFFFIAVWG